MPLSLNYHLTPVCKLVTQWQNVKFRASAMDILKYLKFPPLNLALWACTDELFHTVTEGVVHGVHEVVTRSRFGVV